jgi:predicted GNAT family acetyltransferase
VASSPAEKAIQQSRINGAKKTVPLCSFVVQKNSCANPGGWKHALYVRQDA